MSLVSRRQVDASACRPRKGEPRLVRGGTGCAEGVHFTDVGVCLVGVGLVDIPRSDVAAAKCILRCPHEEVRRSDVVPIGLIVLAKILVVVCRAGEKTGPIEGHSRARRGHIGQRNLRAGILAVQDVRRRRVARRPVDSLNWSGLL